MSIALSGRGLIKENGLYFRNIMPHQAPTHFESAFERRRLALWRSVFRWRTRLAGDRRPSSLPYVSGDSFRAIADHVHDETAEAKPEDISRGEVVFVSAPRVASYFRDVHPRISHPYVLITHNGDTNIDESMLAFIDDKIIRWFAQNAVARHPRMTPIPIGLENLHHYKNGIVSFFRKTQKQIARQSAAQARPSRRARILYHFKVRTNARERQPALDFFSRQPLAETLENKLSPGLYLKELSSYEFVASPPGNGLDCIRTWEAMYLETVPIVKDSAAMRSFESLGLPLWVVRDWDELSNLTESDLQEKYDTLVRAADRRPLYMDYWISMIKDAQTKTS